MNTTRTPEFDKYDLSALAVLRSPPMVCGLSPLNNRFRSLYTLSSLIVRNAELAYSYKDNIYIGNLSNEHKKATRFHKEVWANGRVNFSINHLSKNKR